MRAVVEEGRGVAVEKEMRFYKNNDGEIQGYVNIHAGAEGGREADYVRSTALLKTLGVEKWTRREMQILLTGGALEALMRLEPVCGAVGFCGEAP